MTNNENVFFNVKSINRFDKVKYDEDGQEIHVISLVVECEGDEDSTATIRFYSDENVRINDPELMEAAQKLMEFQSER